MKFYENISLKLVKQPVRCNLYSFKWFNFLSFKFNEAIKMSQPTDLKQKTPISAKRNIAEPSAPIKKKSRRNVTENPQMMFGDWLNQFREMNSKYTNVDLSLHASQSGKPNNFVMLSQRTIKAGTKYKLSILQVHFKYATRDAEALHKSL